MVVYPVYLSEQQQKVYGTSSLLYMYLIKKGAVCKKEQQQAINEK
jgi:hypothetical protein